MSDTVDKILREHCESVTDVWRKAKMKTCAARYRRRNGRLMRRGQLTKQRLTYVRMPRRPVMVRGIINELLESQKRFSEYANLMMAHMQATASIPERNIQRRFTYEELTDPRLGKGYLVAPSGIAHSTVLRQIEHEIKEAFGVYGERILGGGQ